ncbi:hypothetical protein A6C57_01240 [Fibrella sp. ES10-3-2-2]|nr:hypothetical protein A6C57_01240 [Fibrella sp. ES10-3-2-2]
MPAPAITETIALDSADKLRALWPLLSQAKKDELLQAGIVGIALVSAMNAGLDWRVYTGRIDVSSYYRAYGEFIAPCTDPQTISLTQQETQDIALFAMQRRPDIYLALVTANGGNPPEILPPYEPES